MKLVCLIFFAIAFIARLDGLPADPALPKVPDKATPDPSALSKAVNNSHIPDPTDAISKIKGAGPVNPADIAPKLLLACLKFIKEVIGLFGPAGKDIAQQMVKGGEAMMAIPVLAGKTIMDDFGKIFNPSSFAKGAPGVPDANATKEAKPSSNLPESPFNPENVVSAATSFENGVEDVFGGFGI